MPGRRCRIVVSFTSVFALAAAIGFTLWALTSPEWQVGELRQINQFRYVGLFQTCALGYRQENSVGQPTWACTFLPYGQFYFRNQYSLIGGISDALNPGTTAIEAYNVYGNDSWRLSTLILLSMAIFFGFLSLVMEISEIVLDATRTRTCLKAMSGLSLVTLILATLCSLIGMLIFAIESQQNQNLYILELTTFAIFHLGKSFYVGIASMLIFLLALALDITGAVLLCVTAKSPLSSRSQLYYGAEDYAERKEAHPCSDDAQMQRSLIENSYNESLVVPVLWKYPKMTRV